MNIDINNLHFLKSIFPPNYYIASTTTLSENQKIILQKIISEINNNSHNVELNTQQIEAINTCIDDFIKIAESEIQTVSGYSESELINKKINASSSTH